VALLSPAEVLAPLEERAAALAVKIEAVDADLSGAPPLPRVLLLETEYERVLARAELDWLGSVIDDLRSGVLAWTPEQMAKLAAAEKGSD
jgi:hypothetical protein